jgi:Ca-activated chloride channel family protein
MRTWVLTRNIGFYLAGLCALSLFLLSFSRGQSADEIHIVPRTGSNHANSERVPADRVWKGENRPLHVDVDLVLVPVTVNDFLNRPVISLEKEDFAVYEGNQRREIRYFSKDSAPVSVAILLDVSKSMSDKVNSERQAVIDFFKNANTNDEYFAIAFSGRPQLLGHSVSSIDDLEQQLIAIEPGGPTALLDAVYLALSELRFARYGRRAIVIISDGGDNVSQYTLRELKSFVKESDVQIYAIGLFETHFFNTFEERLGKKWLSEITDATGGRTVTVDDRTKLPEAAAGLSREIRNQYVLGYKPTDTAKAGWRRIKVQVTTSVQEKHLRAYYKSGYSPYR